MAVILRCHFRRDCRRGIGRLLLPQVGSSKAAAREIPIPISATISESQPPGAFLREFLMRVEYLVQAIDAVDEAARKDYQLASFS